MQDTNRPFRRVKKVIDLSLSITHTHTYTHILLSSIFQQEIRHVFKYLYYNIKVTSALGSMYMMQRDYREREEGWNERRAMKKVTLGLCIKESGYN